MDKIKYMWEIEFNNNPLLTGNAVDEYAVPAIKQVESKFRHKYPHIESFICTNIKRGLQTHK